MPRKRKPTNTSRLNTEEYGKFLRRLDVVAVGLEEISAKLDRL